MYQYVLALSAELASLWRYIRGCPLWNRQRRKTSIVWFDLQYHGPIGGKILTGCVGWTLVGRWLVGAGYFKNVEEQSYTPLHLKGDLGRVPPCC